MEEFKHICISDIQKNPYQPRKEFSEEKTTIKLDKSTSDLNQ